MSSLRRMTIPTLACVVIAAMASAQEIKIRRSDLPPAVEMTVAEASKGATIKGFSKETTQGKTTYEVEMLVSGHGKDIEIDSSGRILEVEEEVAMASLPPTVAAGLTAKAAGGKILKVESLTKNGKLAAYEAKVETAGKRREIQVGPDGKALDHEE